MKYSLCVLARNRVELLGPLVESVQRSVDAELVIADNSSEPDAQEHYRCAADVYVQCPDEVLWYDGFSAALNLAYKAASYDWIIRGDLGEVWRAISVPSYEVPAWGITTTMGSKAGQRHGRVFDRRKMRQLGLIHEELYEKRTGKAWHQLAKRSVAVVDNYDGRCGAEYEARKWVLYCHLMNEIYTKPELRAGTNSWWWTTYWPEQLEKGTAEVKTFAQWKEMPG